MKNEYLISLNYDGVYLLNSFLLMCYKNYKSRPFEEKKKIINRISTSHIKFDEDNNPYYQMDEYLTISGQKEIIYFDNSDLIFTNLNDEE